MRLIDADALKRECEKLPRVLDDEFIHFVKVKDITKTINNAPTIEAEPVRHGRWIENTDGIYSWIECSECGGCPPRDIDGKIVLSEYCHHCGAKMDGGDEE